VGPTPGATGAVTTVSGISGGSVTFTDETVYVTGSLTGGTITLDNSTLVVEGPSSGGATVIMDGTDTLDLANVSPSKTGNPVVEGLNQQDNIGLGASFTNATANNVGATGATATFTNNGTTVATIATPGIADQFYGSPYSTDTINGTTYTVAVVDPPLPGATGPTHHHKSETAATGVSGGQYNGAGAPWTSSDQTQVGPDNVLGQREDQFLHGSHGLSTDHASGPVLPLDLLRSLWSDLTNVGGSRGGYWTPDGHKGQGTGLPHDRQGQGSVGGLDDHSRSHHDLWKPDHH
jgi:hypothetical protein